jgi:hypothetical protein
MGEGVVTVLIVRPTRIVYFRYAAGSPKATLGLRVISILFVKSMFKLRGHVSIDDGNKVNTKPGHEVVRARCEHVISRAGIEKFAPHDLARTFVRLCHEAGGELDQMNFLLGHV